jgi:Cupin domain
MKVQRVITRQDTNGKSVVVSDKDVDPITLKLLPGTALHQLKGADETDTPHRGDTNITGPPLPPSRRVPVGVSHPPTRVDGHAREHQLPSSAEREAAEKLPNLTDILDPDHPGMHTTDTIDFEIVLSGEITLELDDGAEVTLKSGDTVVQNGTRHAWHNHGDVPAVIAAAIIGAQRA